MIEKYGANAGWMSMIVLHHVDCHVPTSMAVFESSVMFFAFNGEMKLIIFLKYNLYWPQTCVLFMCLTHISYSSLAIYHHP